MIEILIPFPGRIKGTTAETTSESKNCREVAKKNFEAENFPFHSLIHLFSSIKGKNSLQLESKQKSSPVFLFCRRRRQGIFICIKRAIFNSYETKIIQRIQRK